jgi:hypothetical protein
VICRTSSTAGAWCQPQSSAFKAKLLPDPKRQSLVAQLHARSRRYGLEHGVQAYKCATALGHWGPWSSHRVRGLLLHTLFVLRL